MALTLSSCLNTQSHNKNEWNIVNEDLKIANAIEVMLKKSISRLIIADNDQNLLGIVTRTDLINSITNLEQFPIITN